MNIIPPPKKKRSECSMCIAWKCLYIVAGNFTFNKGRIVSERTKFWCKSMIWQPFYEHMSTRGSKTVFCSTYRLSREYFFFQSSLMRNYRSACQERSKFCNHNLSLYFYQDTNYRVNNWMNLLAILIWNQPSQCDFYRSLTSTLTILHAALHSFASV